MKKPAWVFGVVLFVGARLVLSAAIPPTVSPGRTEAVVQVEARCPTFIWGEVEGADGYELLVHAVHGPGEEVEPVLEERFTQAVSAWTPSLDRCLERGARYAWSVRATVEGRPGSWSSPSLFEVARGPSLAQFEEALAIVRDYLASRDGLEAESGEASDEPASEADREPLSVTSYPAAPGTPQLTVDGGVVAAWLSGDGSGLTALSPANLSPGTAPISVTGSATPAGAAGGDLTGTYPNPQLATDSVGPAEIATAAVGTGELAFDPATQSELDAEMERFETQEQCLASRFDGRSVSEVEGSGSLATATRLCFGTASGLLSSSDNKDVFWEPLSEAGAKVWAWVDSRGSDSKLIILRADNTIVATDDDSGPDLTPVIADVGLGGEEKVFYRVEPVGSATFGYRLYSVVDTDRIFTNEVESNDTTGTATALDNGFDLFQGSLSSASDVDYYAFFAPARARAVAIVDNTLGYPSWTDTQLRLLDTDGSTTLATGDNGSACIFSGGSCKANGVAADTVNPGVHFLEVKAGSTSGDYAFVVRVYPGDK